MPAPPAGCAGDDDDDEQASSAQQARQSEPWDTGMYYASFPSLTTDHVPAGRRNVRSSDRMNRRSCANRKFASPSGSARSRAR